METICKYCKSDNVIKYGFYKAVQRYFCNNCKRKFAGIDTIPKMQYPTHQISDALNMYYEGISLNEIRRNLIHQHNSYISDASAFNWVNRFSKMAIKEAEKYKPDQLIASAMIELNPVEKDRDKLKESLR